MFEIKNSDRRNTSFLFFNDYKILRPFRVEINCLNEINSSTTFSDSDQLNEKYDEQLHSDFLFDYDYLDSMKKVDYLKYEECLIRCYQTACTRSQLLSTLARMWKDAKFCDLILVLSNGREFLAFRAVLAFYSEKYK